MNRLNSVLIVAALALPLVAQPKAERRTYAWLCDLRAALAAECAGQSDETIAAVAEILARDARGVHVLPLLRARAHLRKIEPDAAFFARGSLQCFATPEICDVDEIREVSLTVHAPFAVDGLDGFTFVPRIVDAGGREVWRGSITEHTAKADLLRWKTTTKAPLDDLPNGEYSVFVDVIGATGGRPRSSDPRPATRFYVLRGFPQRAAELERRLEELSRREDVPRDAREVVAGVWEPVVRNYYWQGEVPGRRGSLEELKRAARVVDNVAAGKPALEGVLGWVPLLLDLDDTQARVEIRVPPDDAPRPLVVFVPGTPAWMPDWSRPTSPPSTHPRWWRRWLVESRFDPEHAYQLAVMESPGRFRSAAGALEGVIARLRERFVGERPLILVGEREGAAAITGLWSRQHDLARGVALFGGGSLPRETLERTALRELLLVPGVGLAANANLQRIADLARGTRVRARVLPPQPWCLGFELRTADVAKLVADALAPATQRGK